MCIWCVSEDDFDTLFLVENNVYYELSVHFIGSMICDLTQTMRVRLLSLQT